MYCVKCKQKTETTNVEQVTSKNNRQMLRGKCKICCTTKTQFIKVDRGKGINRGKGLVNDFINNLPMELHLPGYNFAGPGTKLNKRLNADLTPKDFSKPINRVDEAAMHHDICYLKNKDTKTRNTVCDEQMLKELNIFNPTLRERIDKSIVGKLISAKKYFGMGSKLKLD